MYGKATENAIAAMTRLAEVYDGGETRLSATDIAESRDLQRPFLAKLLSVLAQAGLVTSTRGPGGGFTLARPPEEITLYDVYRLFEREDASDRCPFGGGICGVGDVCPLHNKLIDVQQAMSRVLNETTFEEFRAAYQDEGRRPAPKSSAGKPTNSSGSTRSRKT